jgi:hypothetical protein
LGHCNLIKLLSFLVLNKFATFSRNCFSFNRHLLQSQQTMRAAAAIILAIIAGFFTVVTGVTVNCNFVSGSYIGIGNVYMCSATNIPQSSNHTVTSVIGTHDSDMTDEDVQMVYIDGNYGLSFVPRGFTNFFPNLIGFYLYAMGFDTLNGDELEEFGEKLVWFGVFGSNLKTISSRLFDFTPNIAYVDFYYNKIQRVGHDLFTGVNVPQLGVLFFSSNICINRSAYNQADIVALINQLQVSCPYDDEVLGTTEMTTAATTTPTTTTTTTTTTTATPITTTPAIQDCFDSKIEDFVCEINDKVGVVQSDLTSTRDDLQSQLDQTNEKLAAKDQRIVELETNFEAIKDELQWMREELLTCACK